MHVSFFIDSLRLASMKRLCRWLLKNIFLYLNQLFQITVQKKSHNTIGAVGF